MTEVAGWGRYPRIVSELQEMRHPRDAEHGAHHAEAWVARGNGRAYGDAGIGASQTLDMRQLDRIRSFDTHAGTITAEAGLLLGDLISIVLPRGFFPFVVPGTRDVTIGGAIASDVHGKNHHIEGGFGDYVEELVLATPQAGVLRVSRQSQPELFAATIGGMGLTGAIIEATIRLRRVETGWIRQHTIVAPDLARAIQGLENAATATYAVAWIDCLARGSNLGRSLIYLGEHARADEVPAQQPRFPNVQRARLAVPFDLPHIALNPLSMRLFNEVYYRRGASRSPTALVPVTPYFFPLDGVQHWNRIYGSRGFVQYQCVIPEAVAEPTLSEILGRTAALGRGSFLAVLKKLGPSNGLLSFPMAGYTLTLDFPVHTPLFPFLDELDRIVVAAGGRLYLAKDARQSRQTFESGYPQLDQMRQVKRSVDPQGRIESILSRRLGI